MHTASLLQEQLVKQRQAPLVSLLLELCFMPSRDKEGSSFFTREKGESGPDNLPYSKQGTGREGASSLLQQAEWHLSFDTGKEPAESSCSALQRLQPESCATEPLPHLPYKVMFCKTLQCSSAPSLFPTHHSSLLHQASQK